MITQTELKELLEYNPETGVFVWFKDNKSKKIKGKVAGCLKSDGYIYIGLNRKGYSTHRLAWLYVYAEWPKGQIDHINGIRNDNRIENLRVVTNRQNGQNLKEHREGKLVGSSYCKNAKKWVSFIRINGKAKYLGYFETEQQAHEAYIYK